MPKLLRPSLNGKHVNGHAILDEARRLHDRGFAVVPCTGKKPIEDEWQKKRLTQDDLDIALRGTNRNIGIALNQSDLIDVECDTPEAEVALQAMFGGAIPPTPTWGSKRGSHRLFKRPSGLPR